MVRRFMAWLVVLWCAISGVVRAGTAPIFTGEELRADLREIRQALFEMPADLSHSTNPRTLDRAIAKLDGQLQHTAPLTRDEAWRLFATLNPRLADGHLIVGFADWRSDVRAHLDGGGTLFPIDVRVDSDCRVSLRTTVNASLKHLEGQRIRSVNDVPMRRLCRQMMERVHGDTLRFRADLLQRRFWLYYWKVHGTPAGYRLVFESGDRLDLPGSSEVPDLLEAEDEFDRQFGLLTVRDCAILKLGTFAWPRKDEVLAFTRKAFESLSDQKTKTLVIDLRDNGGGNDDQWIEGVMPYLATQRWRTASTYRKRVATADPAKGEKVGDMVDGQMQTWYEPQPGLPARFGGNVYVAVGPGTYSSAVVMATVIQDFGFGKIIGSGASVRASQSGGTRRVTLTHSGLVVVTPRFVLRRPSGTESPELLEPDITFEDAASVEEMAAELNARQEH